MTSIRRLPRDVTNCDETVPLSLLQPLSDPSRKARRAERVLRAMPMAVTKPTCSDNIFRYIVSASAPRAKMFCCDHETASLFHREPVFFSKSSDVSIPHGLAAVEAFAPLDPACSQSDFGEFIQNAYLQRRNCHCGMRRLGAVPRRVSFCSHTRPLSRAPLSSNGSHIC